jgi:hypothetical protein
VAVWQRELRIGAVTVETGGESRPNTGRMGFLCQLGIGEDAQQHALGTRCHKCHQQHHGVAATPGARIVGDVGQDQRFPARPSCHHGSVHGLRQRRQQ